MFRVSRPAFTLFELILVLFIISLVMLMAVPRLSGFVQGRIVGDAATHFLAATRYARSHAITDAKPYRINIDSNTRSWWITRDDGAGAFANLPPSEDSPAFQLPENVDMQVTAPRSPESTAANGTAADSLSVIEFQPTGRTDPATITFTGPKSSTTTISCPSPFELFRLQQGGAQ